LGGYCLARYLERAVNLALEKSMAVKTAAGPSPRNLGVIVPARFFLGVVFVAVTDRPVPVIPSMRAAMLALPVIGMAMRALGGIAIKAAQHVLQVALI
jgi:hypothetical protein